MKLSLVTLFSCLILFNSCYKMQYVEPQASVMQDGHFGYWKLESYRIGKRDIPISQVPEMCYIKSEMAIVQVDSTYKSAMYPEGRSYWKFTFFNAMLHQEVVRRALRYDSDYIKKTKQDYQWFQMDEISGFLVILDVVRNGFASRMQLSNVIQGPILSVKLDSIRYVYRPTAKFD